MRKKTKILLASTLAVLACTGVGVGVHYALNVDNPPVEDDIPVDPGVTPPDDGGEEQPLVYSMTFKIDEEMLTSVSVANGGLITPPDSPKKEGYIFQGWALQGTTDIVDFSTLTATENMTFVAVFEEITYQVTFSVDGEETTQQVSYQGYAVAPTAPSKEGYIFTGWAIEGTTEVVDLATTIITEDTTFVAIWIDEPIKVTSASLFTFDGAILTGYVGEETDIVIPSTYSLDAEGNPIDGEDIAITKIGDAFNGNEAIKSVVIPEGVTSVGKFSDCKSLENVAFSSTVNSIGVFSYCSSLKNIVVPEGVTILNGLSFYGCTSLESVILPSTLTTIKDSAFGGCSSLKNIVVPEGVTTFKSGVFSNCTSLESVSLPSTLSSVVDNPFYGCTSLTSIVVADGNATFDSRDNCNAVVETSTNTLITGCKTTIVPSSVKVIAYYSFYSVDISNVQICEGVEEIEKSAFSYAMGNCLTIPSSVTNIGNHAFGTYDIDSIILLAETPAQLTGVPVWSKSTIYVPDEAVDAYKEAWADCASQIKPVSEYVS